MTKREENKAIKILRNSIIDELITEIDKLNININTETLSEKLKDNKKKERKPIKVPVALQCKSLKKNGEKCTVSMCDKKLKKCWAHMKKEERNNYLENKHKKIAAI